MEKLKQDEQHSGLTHYEHGCSSSSSLSNFSQNSFSILKLNEIINANSMKKQQTKKKSKQPKQGTLTKYAQASKENATLIKWNRYLLLGVVLRLKECEEFWFVNGVGENVRTVKGDEMIMYFSLFVRYKWVSWDLQGEIWWCELMESEDRVCYGGGEGSGAVVWNLECFMAVEWLNEG